MIISDLVFRRPISSSCDYGGSCGGCDGCCLPSLFLSFFQSSPYSVFLRSSWWGRHRRHEFAAINGHASSQLSHRIDARHLHLPPPQPSPLSSSHLIHPVQLSVAMNKSSQLFIRGGEAVRLYKSSPLLSHHRSWVIEGGLSQILPSFHRGEIPEHPRSHRDTRRDVKGSRTVARARGRGERGV